MKKIYLPFIILFSLILISFVFIYLHREKSKITTLQGTIKLVDSEWNLYTNNTYHFSIKIPQKIFSRKKDASGYDTCDTDQLGTVVEKENTIAIATKCESNKQVTKTDLGFYVANGISDTQTLHDFLVQTFGTSSNFSDAEKKPFTLVEQRLVVNDKNDTENPLTFSIFYSGAPYHTMVIEYPAYLQDKELPRDDNGQFTGYDYAPNMFSSFRFLK